MKKLLFEIGVEEIPARFIAAASADLKRLVAEKLAAAGIFPESSTAEAFGTPRRLALIVSGIPEMQPDRSREVFGPPAKVAFDENGKPTKAAEKFAQSAGLAPEQLTVKEKGQGKYVVALVQEKGLPAKEVLPGILKESVLALNFPKSMRWGEGDIRFVRPIRWILALLDSDVIEFELDGVKSANITRGHRFLSPVAFQVREAGLYKSSLETSFIIVEPEKRRALIEADLNRLAATVEGVPAPDEELAGTVVNLVEYPVGVLCEFPREYLELPDELLITVMKGHQKYFAVKDDKGRLLNNFIVISNTLKENSLVVRGGAERVIKARFEDARFYYREDLSRKLADRVDDLKKVAYHEKLGSLYDKTLRLQAIASKIAQAVCPEIYREVERAARLAKADLVSGVVKEFPELQGIMGRYYALAGGEPETVADAIMEQYLPRFTGGALPSSPAATVLALADRLDNIASFFYLGLAPTGSEDPFALRRQAIAVENILLEGGQDLTLGRLIDWAAAGLGQEGNEALKSEIFRFLESRLPQILEARGYAPDVIESVIKMSASVPLKDLPGRMDAIVRFKRAGGYGTFLMAMKRVRNIIADRAITEVHEKLLKEEKEAALYRAFTGVREKVRELAAMADYERAMETLLELNVSINEFFDAVLVMDKNAAVRDNRLALLGAIWALALSIADFSRLSEI